jgi:hypothetical protein
MKHPTKHTGHNLSSVYFTPMPPFQFCLSNGGPFPAEAQELDPHHYHNCNLPPPCAHPTIAITKNLLQCHRSTNLPPDDLPPRNHHQYAPRTPPPPQHTSTLMKLTPNAGSTTQPWPTWFREVCVMSSRSLDSGWELARPNKR